MKLSIALAAFVIASSARADALDDLFARYKADTPGCAIGVARAGQPTLLRGYGSADLEHGVPITPDTIFEAGSVSKQFTAAAILTLVADGKIALSDDIRKYLPEMPAYSAPITVDMLLSHTSGLRDWGEVEDIAGWPRGSRIYTHDEVLQIAARQKALNYAPGTAYSYTNTGYNLAAIIVQRVSGRSLADFTAERLFKPLGMAHTGWRDDFRRIVPGRAQAYDRIGASYQLDMPFENVHGNSALLTTVGDLLIWNQALTDRKLGVVADQLQLSAVLKDGSKIAYARGLMNESHRGVAEVSHSGSTAGYRAWLARYPAEGVSVAMLCNAGNASSVPAGRLAADLYLSHPPTAPAAAEPTPPSELAARPGFYVGQGAFATTEIVAEGHDLRLKGGPTLLRQADGAYRAGPFTLRFQADGGMVSLGDNGDTFRREARVTPTPADLALLAGTYVSDEAGATLRVSVRDGALAMVPSDRPSDAVVLTAAFKDGFLRPYALVRFQRNKAGKVTGLSYKGGRVWNLRFRKTG
ncbi:serine hydrolase domain-containing protein [Phenylobacterium sp.]|uniref:serine hydrolase domain-containing protein n=1 Tax=Phenylobacterium sp. TaxID=1871053 RepID=UPI002B7B1485|nr:serine hydrolase domain-containing protein [Phenylobacterium sp.]HLZ73462.1 serine hydrolase domain-containing protein [Phenylobacterium sp.]